MRRKGMRFGHYALDSVVGYGELGIVYRAADRETGETVALKVLRPHLSGDERVEELFLRGPTIASRVRHRNVAAVREIGTAEGKLYYAMEFVEGRPLAQVLHRQGLPLEERLRVLVRVARAVDHLHRCGVVHGDLKPSNILLAPGGEPKITDFESAVLRAQVGDGAAMALLQSGILCGTPPYLAPEVLRGEGSGFDPRRDVYALGVMAYRMAAGVMPYAASDLMALTAAKESEAPAMDLWDVTVAPRLEATIRRALMPDAAERWATADDFARAVEGYLRGARGLQPVAASARAEQPAAAGRRPLRLPQPINKAACL